MIKDLPEDLDSIPELRRSPGEGNGYPLQYLAWRTPWTVEPGSPLSMGLWRVRHDWATNTFRKSDRIQRLKYKKLIQCGVKFVLPYYNYISLRKYFGIYKSHHWACCLFYILMSLCLKTLLQLGYKVEINSQNSTE